MNTLWWADSRLEATYSVYIPVEGRDHLDNPGNWKIGSRRLSCHLMDSDISSKTSLLCWDGQANAYIPLAKAS